MDKPMVSNDIFFPRAFIILFELNTHLNYYKLMAQDSECLLKHIHIGFFINQ